MRPGIDRKPNGADGNRGGEEDGIGAGAMPGGRLA
jgi:hypothetical protein